MGAARLGSRSLACAGQFALFVLVVTRGARSPLALPLALLAFDLLYLLVHSLACEVS